MMTYEERQVIREVLEDLKAIRFSAIGSHSSEFGVRLGRNIGTAKHAAIKLEALLSDPDDLPSESYDANDAQEMGRL